MGQYRTAGDVFSRAQFSNLTTTRRLRERHFADSVGWPLLLIALGFVILLAGVAFARLSGKIKEPVPHDPC